MSPFFHRRNVLAGIALSGALALGGCATQADVQYVQRDVRDARRAAADAQSMVNSLRNEVQKLRGEIEELRFTSGPGGQREELVRRIESLEAKVAALEDQIRAGEGAPTRSFGMSGEEGSGEPVQTAVEIGPAPSNAPEEYREGIELLRSGDGQGAIQRFREFLRRSPRSDLADDAQYWIGEAYYARGDYNRAILELNEVLLRYPKEDRVPAALLRQAAAFSELGDKVDARLVLQKLVSEHGDTPEADAARRRLETLAQ